jgi:AraC-like DNA-binding protein
MRISKNPYLKSFYIWDSFSAVFYHGAPTPSHSHSTIQLVFDISDVFRCRIGDNPWEECRCIIIDENTFHELDSNGSVQLIIYLDPQSSVSKALRFKYLDGKCYQVLNLSIVECVGHDKINRCFINPRPEILNGIIFSMFSRLLDEVKVHVVADQRIQKVLTLIGRLPASDSSVNSLAAEVFVSPSRLRFLFKQSTGISLHRFILWNKIKKAIVDLTNGASIQEAALDQGFADSSHFHKQLVKMFGISPSRFLKSHSMKSVTKLVESPMKMSSLVNDDPNSVADW